MNYINKIAEMLGVEIGEEFKINEFADSPKYRLNEDTELVLQCYGNYNKKWFDSPTTLLYLISGKYTIEKLPWKPKYKDRY